MKYLFLLACALLGLLTSPLAAQATNPLPNPGFESGTDQWSVADDVSQLLPGAARTGTKGLRVGTMEYTSTGSSITSSRFPVVPDQEITLSFWARSQGDLGAAYLLFFKSDGKWAKNFPCGVRKGDGEWNHYTMTAKAPADAATVAIWIHSYSSARGTIDFDDFALGGITPGTLAQAPPPPRKSAAAPAAVPAVLPARQRPPVIILKLDDLKLFKTSVHPAWQKVADYLESRQIKGSMGVVCQTLQEATPQYIDWIRKRHDSGRLEFWFHGWDHAVHEEGGEKYNEFNHRTYEDQKDRFDKSQKLALEKLGFAFKTFGPGGGVGTASYDENTCRVMADDPYMKAWLYPSPINELGKKLAAGGKVVILDRVWDVNIEAAVGVPDSKKFIQGYAKHPDREYFVLQGHPAMWNPDRFAEFEKIIDFLVEQKAQFMTPSEYLATLKK